jgi:pimeloyl-ACP methyl ester carboxylesterase
MKTIFKIADSLFPSIAAKQVYKVMSNPRIKKLRDFEEEILAKAAHERISFKKFEIQIYKWGNPNDKAIFMVHGWEGQAGNFGALVDILLAKKYYVVAFDAPSHGKSSKGKTNMFEFGELLKELFQKYKAQSIISHSFGSVMTLVALSARQNIPIDQWIMVTTPHNFKDRIEDVKKFIGFSDKTLKKVIYKLETETGYKVDNMNMEYFGDKVSHVKEIIIVHSKSDKIIPINSARIAHQNISHSELIELDNLGHYRILWSDELKEIITNRIA